MTAVTKPEGGAAQRRHPLERLPERIQPQLANLLPEGYTPQRFLTDVALAFTKNPKLAECTFESLALSVLQAAQAGLQIGRTAHLVPFWNSKKRASECQFVPDWKGLCQLAYESSYVRDVRARVVYEGEPFQYIAGSQESIVHHPAHADHPRKIVAAYAVVVKRHQHETYEVMSREEIEAIRQRAPSKDSPAWQHHYGEMCKKTVIKRILKRLPQVPARLAAALQFEEERDDRERAGEISYVRGPSVPQIPFASYDDGNGEPSASGADDEPTTGENPSHQGAGVSPTPASDSPAPSAEQQQLVEEPPPKGPTKEEKRVEMPKGGRVQDALELNDRRRRHID